MNSVRVLDCTLRDGGYVNDFRFGQFVITETVSKLSQASIDIVECGFLSSQANDPDCSLFGSVESIARFIYPKKQNVMYVAMIQYGAISLEEISPYDGSSIDGIRVTFHEHEIDPAFQLGKALMEKGYRVFMQPVGTTTYTEESLLSLIEKVNLLNPFAFYIVDTLGLMYKNDLIHMFRLIDSHLNPKICIGFHSHNNLQMSFANAQELIDIRANRPIIIDASLYGMGRGAGNLNTELITQYINHHLLLKYDCLQLLELIDEYIKPLSSKYKWGYDAAYYLSSTAGCHPNYAFFLLNKQSLRVQDIYAILNRLDNAKRSLYDANFINEEYLKFMNHVIDDQEVISRYRTLLKDKPVLLLAPGKSLRYAAETINKELKNKDYFVISINFAPTDIPFHTMFISNIKRFKNFQSFSDSANKFDIIATSNLSLSPCQNIYAINYSSYINEEQCIIDNAGLMCMNFLKKVGVQSIVLAGFDGYSEKADDNFFDEKFTNVVDAERYRKMNAATKEKLQQLSSQLSISFLTDSSYR